MRDDCGQCPACADKPGYGGWGSKKKVENRSKYLQINKCKIKRNNCKIKMNNCKIKVNNVEAVCYIDKPQFGGCGSENTVVEIFMKMLNCLKIHLVW